MRPSRLIVVLMIALAAAGCLRRPAPPVAVAPRTDLDSLMYGHGAARPSLSRSPAVVVAARAPPVMAVAPLPAAAAVAEPPYALDSGDKLRIVVFGQEGLTNTYVVDAAGTITMPLIGAVSARALTTRELAHAVAGRLRQGFIREPHVAIEVDTYRPFFILGEVTAPGQYPYVPKMTVETAVAVAGGFTPRADRWRFQISRTVNGQTLRAAVPPLYPVGPGDTVTVGERWF